MSECCTPAGCSTTAEPASELCPSCRSAGIDVDPITLKALLTPDGLRRGVPAVPRYCPTAHCPTVYFSSTTGVQFGESEVIVPVYAKQMDREEVPICYCFASTGKSIRDEIESTGASTATAAITADVKSGRCACEVKNPKGSCCLGDIARAERRIAADLTRTASLGA